VGPPVSRVQQHQHAPPATGPPAAAVVATAPQQRCSQHDTWYSPQVGRAGATPAPNHLPQHDTRYPPQVVAGAPPAPQYVASPEEDLSTVTRERDFWKDKAEFYERERDAAEQACARLDHKCEALMRLLKEYENSGIVSPRAGVK
jgi:hypothetical protein